MLLRDFGAIHDTGGAHRKIKDAWRGLQAEVDGAIDQGTGPSLAHAVKFLLLQSSTGQTHL